MIFYRLLGNSGYKSRWVKVVDATTLRQGVDYVAENTTKLAKRGIDRWEVGCKVPPKDTPQARRSGSFER